MQKFRVILMTGPFGQVVIDVDNPLFVEDVAGGFECSRDFRNMTEVEQGRKGEPHSAPFIGNQCSAAPATDFARKDSFMPELFSVDEPEGFEPLRYSDVTLVKNGRPLHRRSVQFLAGQAVAEFGIHGIRAHLVLNRAAVAACTVFGYKVRIPY